MAATTQELAYYYPEPYWNAAEVDGLKNLLLFFDGVAILLPRYMKGVEIAVDPFLAGPMLEQGLLRVLEPETFVDQDVTEKLITAVTELVISGAFDDLDRKTYYAELSRSRMGWDADVELSQMIIEELTARGLAQPSEDGVSVPLHPTVRTTFLVLLSQLAREAGRRSGLSLHPATSQRAAAGSLLDVLASPVSPSAGHLVTLDLEAVGVNLAAVPLDEVVAFRTEHGASYRAYARDLRLEVQTLAAMEPEDRAAHVLDREEMLADIASDLRKSARRGFGRQLSSFLLGLAGAAWTMLGQGDPIGAALAASSAVVGVLPDSGPETVSAYSYVFSAMNSYRAR